MTTCIYCGAKLLGGDPSRPCACMSCLKTHRQAGILKRVEFMPEVYEPGIFYYSERFGGFGYLCHCGCGEKIYIPVVPEGTPVTNEHSWMISIRDEKVTLDPSLLNRIPCGSHYFIRDSEVVWA